MQTLRQASKQQNQQHPTCLTHACQGWHVHAKAETLPELHLLTDKEADWCLLSKMRAHCFQGTHLPWPPSVSVSLPFSHQPCPLVFIPKMLMQTQFSALHLLTWSWGGWQGGNIEPGQLGLALLFSVAPPTSPGSWPYQTHEKSEVCASECKCTPKNCALEASMPPSESLMFKTVPSCPNVLFLSCSTCLMQVNSGAFLLSFTCPTIEWLVPEDF